MKEHYYIKNNNHVILDKLRHSGYSICNCCSYIDAEWLSVYPKGHSCSSLEMSVHGTGYGCENECSGMCPSKCIMCSIKEIKGNIHIFNDADSLLEFTKHLNS